MVDRSAGWSIAEAWTASVVRYRASRVAGSAELSAGAPAQLRLQRAGRRAQQRHQCAERRLARASGASAAGVADQWSARYDGGAGCPQLAAGPARHRGPRRVTVCARSLGVGILASIGSAVTGVTDWQHTHEEDRRVGLVHGVVNLVATALYAMSWWDRRQGRHGRGIAPHRAGLRHHPGRQLPGRGPGLRVRYRNRPVR